MNQQIADTIKAMINQIDQLRSNGTSFKKMPPSLVSVYNTLKTIQKTDLETPQFTASQFKYLYWGLHDVVEVARGAGEAKTGVKQSIMGRVVMTANHGCIQATLVWEATVSLTGRVDVKMIDCAINTKVVGCMLVESDLTPMARNNVISTCYDTFGRGDWIDNVIDVINGDA